MKPRTALLTGGILATFLAGSLAAGLFATSHPTTPATIPAPAPAPEPDLPVPPIPPRIGAGADYEKCLGMIASDPAAAVVFADAWQATGGPDGATHCHGLALVAAGDVAHGANMLESLGRTSHAPAIARAGVFGEANQAWLLAGDPQHAMADATLALTLAPTDPDLLVDRAVTAARLAHYQDAIDDLDHAIDTDPTRADALVFRGSAWRHLGQPDLATDDIARALAQQPDNADALLERGILREQAGDPKGARTDWLRVKTLAPDTPTSQFAAQNLALLDQQGR